MAACPDLSLSTAELAADLGVWGLSHGAVSTPAAGAEPTDTTCGGGVTKPGLRLRVIVPDSSGRTEPPCVHTGYAAVDTVFPSATDDN